ncbi:MAG: PEP-CTERM sorting domain-containing protein [Candidatus Thiodiazotropha sp. (ex Lucinoma borealis)]|nr:PEP-CTERM sorting domain-containing protein [Candidatus Thiodiazotropha sp. (ex Lucinoma borealis)]MCU7865410.1 PEP-CTERM sorting domain-containing protein [Candidatus Thiodiazotropha sp. (ex Lucinoma borealis)]
MLIRIATIIIFLSFPKITYSALIQTDWLIAPGIIEEGIITLDTSTNLEWLSPERMLGRSSSSVNLWMSDGFLKGWRFAEEDEVVGLLGNFGFPGYDYSLNGSHSDPDLIDSSVNMLTSYLGDTVSSRSLGNVQYSGVLGVIEGQEEGLNGFAAYTISINGNVDYTHYGSFCCVEDPISSTTSYFLVRETPSPVPVPAVVWLFGSGLIGLVGFTRRKKT